MCQGGILIIFNDRLRLLRKEKKLKQTEMAEFLGISYRNYQRLESNGEKPQYDTLLQIADVCQVSLDWLTGRTDNRQVLKRVHKKVRLRRCT